MVSATHTLMATMAESHDKYAADDPEGSQRMCGHDALRWRPYQEQRNTPTTDVHELRLRRLPCDIGRVPTGSPTDLAANPTQENLMTLFAAKSFFRFANASLAFTMPSFFLSVLTLAKTCTAGALHWEPSTSFCFSA